MSHGVINFDAPATKEEIEENLPLIVLKLSDLGYNPSEMEKIPDVGRLVQGILQEERKRKAWEGMFIQEAQPIENWWKHVQENVTKSENQAYNR